MKYKFVFIDLDDTIWDFHANAKSALQEIYHARKLQQYFDSFEQYFGIYAKRNLELWDLYGRGEITKDHLSRERFLHPLQEVGINNPELAENIGREYLEMLPSRTELMPFAKEILEYLHQKYPLTIVSNGFIEVQYKKLRSANLEHYFSHVVLSEEAKALKPDKRIFEYALNLNKATAAETIMIGDSFEADIIGAQNAGIDQVYFNPNLNETDNDLQCTFKINNLDKLLTFL